MEIYFGDHHVKDLVSDEESKLNLIVRFKQPLSGKNSLLLIDAKTYHPLWILINLTTFSDGDQIGEYMSPTAGNCYLLELRQQASKLPTSVDINTLSEQPLITSRSFCVTTNTMTEKQEKYCRCVLDVESKNENEVYNPYAVCAKSVGTTYRRCTEDYYDFNTMPLNKLNAYARLHKLKVEDTKEAQLVVINNYLNSK